MQSEEDTSNTYYIQYIRDLVKAVNPKDLEKVDQLIILSTSAEGNHLDNIMQRFKKPGGQIWKKMSKPGVPFFQQIQGNKIMANFGMYFMRDAKDTTTSRQSMLNLLYTLRFVKKIKVILAISQKCFIDTALTQLVLALKHLSSTFRQQMIKTDDSTVDSNLIDAISCSMSLLIVNQTINQRMQYKEILNTKTKQSQTIAGSQLMKKVVHNILKHNLIMEQKNSNELIWQKIGLIKGFYFEQKSLIAYFRYNIRDSQAEHEKKRKIFVLRNMGYFLETIREITNSFEQKLTQIFSFFDENKTVLSQIQKQLPMIDFKDLVISQFETQKQIIIITIKVLQQIKQLVLRYKQYEKIERICIPCQLIQTIYKYKTLTGLNSLNQSQMYMFGQLTKISFSIFNYQSRFKELNQQIGNKLPKYFTSILTHLTWGLPTWIDMKKTQKIRPKTILRIIEQIQKLLQSINDILDNHSFIFQNHYQDIKDQRTYIQIGLVNLKGLYLDKMVKHLTITQKIDFMSKLHESITNHQDYLTNINQQGTVNLLKLIYQIMGDELVSCQLYYNAIQCYQKGYIFSKLYETCKKYLINKLQQITFEIFEKIIKIFIKLGMLEQVKKSCYKYLEVIPKSQQVYIYQLLYSISKQEIEQGNTQYMDYINNTSINLINILDKTLYDQMVDLIKQNNKEALKKLPEIPKKC